MSATTVPIDTPERAGKVISIPVAASTLIPAGALVAENASGYAVNASDATGLKVIGRAEETIDNSAGSAGDLSITVKRGVFKFAINSTDLTIADEGKPAFVLDNQTLTNNAGTTYGIKAGIIVDVDSGYAWIDTTLARALPAVPGSFADVAAVRTYLLSLVAAL